MKQNNQDVLHHGIGLALHSGRVRRIAWAILIAMSGLIIVNALVYFSFRRDLPFLQENGTLVSDPIWRACFTGHVLGGILCLASAPFLFWDGLRVRSPAVHRGLGRRNGRATIGGG